MADKEQGLVVATRGRLFEVRARDGARLKCEVRQRVKRDADCVTPVAVGDDVVFSRGRGKRGVVEEVLERRSMFFRPQVGAESVRQVIATNLDRLAAIGSLKSPPLKTGLIDRFLIAAAIGNLEPVIVINKLDLAMNDDFREVVAAYESIGYPVFTLSATTGESLDDFRESLKDHRTLFVGHSGVGKSSLLNALSPGLELKTREVSRNTNRGKHTTTNVELFELPDGGYVVDSPGLKVMGLWEVERSELPYYYPEFETLSHLCRFQPCTHSHEPDCAVKAAVEGGAIFRFRYENYLAIAESLD